MPSSKRSLRFRVIWTNTRKALSISKLSYDYGHQIRYGYVRWIETADFAVVSIPMPRPFSFNGILIKIIV